MRRLAVAAAAVALAGPAVAGGKQPLEISLSLARELYVSGEDVALRVSLRNTGSRALRLPTPFDNRNWQPKFVVQGPGGSRTFSARDVALPHAARNPPRSSAVLVDVPAGEKLEGEIPLHRLTDLKAAGQYSVAMRLRWGSLDVGSTDVRFRVEPARIRGATLVPDARGARVLWIQDGEAPALMEQLLFESPDGRSALLTHFVRRVAPVPVGATSPFGSPMRASVRESLQSWVGFREPGALVVIGASRVRVPLPDGALVAREAFLDANGELGIVVADGNALSLMRVAQDSARTAWTVQLPRAPAAIAASERPDRKGGQKIAILTASRDGVDVSVADAAIPVLGPSAHAEGVGVLAQSALALRVAEDGSAHVAVVVVHEHETAMLQARFGPDGAPVGDTDLYGTKGVTTLPSVAVATFRPSGEAAWVALLPSGSVVSSLWARAPDFRGTPLVPLQLYAVEDKLYLLVQSADRAPELSQIF